ncbi:hypothetical protein KX928_11540 [Roseobacter sp. YSTF-M11]|uniref:Uncharacterized protein n=1 Tax=Roseobacter insulae TaxID=2859783 RepID=A0A9X1K3A2_9RHOB|nr:Rid family hydrolase [Roseobacter insulae]MBW4708417.1 hypothetical protein [Roseobacter insulae]
MGEAEHRVDSLNALSLQFDAEDRAAIRAAVKTLGRVPGDCGDEYHKPPCLTASGDLSDHLHALPPVFGVISAPARPKKSRALSGSIYEEKAGFARAHRTGTSIRVSGTTATDPHGNPLCAEDVKGQAAYTLDKIPAAVGSLWRATEDVVRTRIYLRGAGNWQAVSRVHARCFRGGLPANTLIGGVQVIGPYAVEIEAEADVDPS